MANQQILPLDGEGMTPSEDDMILNENDAHDKYFMFDHGKKQRNSIGKISDDDKDNKDDKEDKDDGNNESEDIEERKDSIASIVVEEKNGVQSIIDSATNKEEWRTDNNAKLMSAPVNLNRSSMYRNSRLESDQTSNGSLMIAGQNFEG